MNDQRSNQNNAAMASPMQIAEAKELQLIDKNSGGHILTNNERHILNQVINDPDPNYNPSFGKPLDDIKQKVYGKNKK